MLLLGLLGVIGLVLGVVRLLNPEPTVLATFPLEQGAARASIQLAKPSDVSVLLNVTALGRMDSTDLHDDLARSKLVLTASNPEATARCAAFNGWSSSGNEERRKRVPRIKQAENACSLKAAQGESLITVELDWKGKSQRPRVEALLVTP
jgi:hypothetical protein